MAGVVVKNSWCCGDSRRCCGRIWAVQDTCEDSRSHLAEGTLAFGAAKDVGLGRGWKGGPY